jgi:hypothetical protein
MRTDRCYATSAAPAVALGIALGVGLTLGAAAPAAGQSCLGPNPAFGSNSLLLGSLRPTDVGQVPDLRDSTNYTGQSRPDWRYPLFTGLDVEGGYMFVSYSTGVQIWSITGAFQANPQRVAERDGWRGEFLSWAPGNTETREWLFDVDVPDGNSNLMAAAGIAPAGVSIWKTTNKTNPSALYQDRGLTAYQIYTARLGGRDYAFAAVEQSTANGLQVYDMTAALGFPGGCSESTSSGQINCPGVYLGRLGTAGSVSYVDGVEISGGRHFVAFSSGSPAVGSKGVEIWEVTDIDNPRNIKPSGGRYLDTEGLYGVALWSHGANAYMALHTLDGGRIYDVGQCLTGSCGSLNGNQVWSRAWSVSSARRFVTDSKSGEVPFLYFGSENMCSAGLQREWLFNVSTPSAPDEEGAGLVINWPNPGGTPNPYPIDYWSWYYSKSPTGFSLVMPRMGKFNGGYFYRAAWTLLDVHQLNVLPPDDMLFEDGFESGDLGAWSASEG